MEEVSVCRKKDPLDNHKRHSSSHQGEPTKRVESSPQSDFFAVPIPLNVDAKCVLQERNALIVLHAVLRENSMVGRKLRLKRRVKNISALFTADS
jgi:hypothetical protein